MAVTVAATARTTPSPAQVVTVSGLTVGTDASVTVLRAWSGQQATVRGGSSAVVTGATMVIVDYEAPLGVSSSYQVTVRDASGAVTGQASAAAPSLTDTQPWISDPLAPAVCGRLSRLAAAGLSTLTYTRTGDVLQPLGARLPVGIAGTRMAAAGVPLDVLCATPTERDAVLAVLLSADPVCLRLPGDDPRYSMLPPLCYVTTDTITQQPLDVQRGGSWTAIAWSVSLVRPPASTIAAPVRTYADVLTDAATYGDLTTLYTDYNALMLGG